MSARTWDWDAVTYDRVSAPQEEWARDVLARLPLGGDETVLDAGCGSGGVTALLIERLPRGRVIAVDSSLAMIEKAKGVLRARDEALVSDLVELELPGRVDAVFSNAVFHWIEDHDRLFTALAAAMRPGAMLVAQCGGEGNVARFMEASESVLAEEPFATHVRGWARPWRFAGPDETTARLVRAGFAEVRCWLEPRLVRPPEPFEFVRVACLGPHLEALPGELHERFIGAVAARCGDPLELDYVRLNIEAVRR